LIIIINSTKNPVHLADSKQDTRVGGAVHKGHHTCTIDKFASEKTIVQTNMRYWGTWVAQLVKHPALDFGSVHDLRVVRLSSTLGSVLGMEPA